MRGRRPMEATVQRVILFSLREGWGSELGSGWSRDPLQCTMHKSRD